DGIAGRIGRKQPVARRRPAAAHDPRRASGDRLRLRDLFRGGLSFEGVKRSAKRPRTTRTVADVLPATADRWTDLLALFGPQGACDGCWCQYWRRPRAEWRQARASGNRAELERQVHGKRPPGLIGYSADGTPVGWVSLGPREDFPGLRNSRFFGDTPP